MSWFYVILPLMLTFFRSHRGLFLALIIYLYLAGLYFFLVPLFEGPDEWTHSGHVKYIATGHGLPVMLPGQGIWGGQQPPLYYVGGALLMQPFDLTSFDEYETQRKNPHASLGYALDPGNKNNYLHLADEAFPYRGLALAIHILRLYSIGYGLITLIFLYLTAYDFATSTQGNGAGFATVVTLGAAMQPMFAFITATVANEPANMACCAGVVWLSQRYVLYGPSPHLRRAVALGVGLGLVSLAKMTGLAVGLVAVVAFLQTAWAARRHPQAAYWLWRDGFIIMGCFLLIGGWWYGRNYYLYGDLFQTKLYEIYFHDTPDPITLDHFLYVLRSSEVSFWATFGWLNLVAPPWVYQFYAFISRIGLLALGFMAVLYVKRNRTFNLKSPYLLHAVFPLALAFSLTRLVAIEGGMQGRQLLPALGSMTILAVAGWQFGGQHLHQWGWIPAKTAPVIRVFIALLFSVALYLPLAVVAPAYIPSPFLPEQALPPALTRLGWVYRDDMELLGVTLDSYGVRPGDTLFVTAYWQALRPITINYSVFVHLIGRNGQTVGQLNSYPGLGLRPTTTLPTGQIFKDVYPVQIAGGAAAPTRLRVNLGLFDFNEPGRPGIPAQNRSDLPPTVGQLKLTPTNWPRPVASPLAQYTDQIALLDSTLTGCQAVTQNCTLTLTWQAQGQPRHDYTVFIQLWQGETLIQGFDAPPLNNDYPTSLWAQDEVILDPHALNLASLTPGKYTLWVGLYEPQSGARLPVISGRPDQATSLGEISLQP